MERKELGEINSFFISVIGIVIVLSILKTLQHIFLPLVIAFFIMLVFHPLNKYLINKKIPKALTVFLNLILLVLLFGGIINVLFSSLSEFISQLPDYKIKLDKIFHSYAAELGIRNFTLTKWFEQNVDIATLFEGLFSSTMSFISIVFLVLFFFLFLSSGIEKFTETIIRYFSKDGDERLENRIKNIPVKIQSYIITKTFISLLTAVLIGIVLFVFDVDFWMIWVSLTFLLNFIPNFGSIIATLLPTTMVLIQYNSLSKTMFFVLAATLIQNIVGNYLEPKILGEKLGLNPIVILLSLLIWGYIWGIAGMFLAVPITAIIKIMISGTESKKLNFISELIS